ncbi:hypothetical protein [Streptomyces sp. NPDC050287]|uniref:hypothetical protein n=1 Tax=Streptomyces sp. NPDC050287 TaxID=3365608 RepID=UPI00378CDED1
MRAMLGGRFGRHRAAGVAATEIQENRQGQRGITHQECGRRARWVAPVLWLVAKFVAAPFAQ